MAYQNFNELLIQSGYLHQPLGMEYFEKNALSRECLEKEAEESISLNTGFTHRGRGELKEENGVFTLRGPLTLEAWGEGYPPDGDYCNFGQCALVIPVENRDLSAYNRLRFFVYASECGVRTPQIYTHLVNDGEVKVPDPHGRTGTHQITLDYGKWKECVWEFPELARDKVTEIVISMPLNGSDGGVADFGEIKVKGLCLETVANPESFEGWQCRGIVCSSRYGLKGAKKAVTQVDCSQFRVMNPQNGESREFQAEETEFRGERYRILDFSAVNEAGTYILEAGGIKSHPFTVGGSFDEPLWLLTNFIYSERCGCNVPHKHCNCHGDIKAEHNGTVLAYNGGWHDAGDLSQQTLQTGEIALALYRARTEDAVLQARLREEARWGIDFILKTRFGDGYRATSAGLTRFTDNKIGNMDDVTARVHDHALENWLLSAIECEAAAAEKGEDRGLSDILTEAAWQDYFFACERFDAFGTELPILFEHSYNSPVSFYYAAAVWAASSLLHQGGDPRAEEVRNNMEKNLAALLKCQQTDSSLPVSGFFCRDEALAQPVHFNHQSREHIYAYALCGAARVLGGGELKEKTETAVKAYGAYYKSLMRYASPYGMIPSGVYYVNEADDAESFKLLHLYADYETERENFIEQVKGGVRIAEGMYVKMFPVWFSFRGNGAVMLSQAAAARELGRYLEDSELDGIVMSQIYFTLGNNPFGQSFIYGEGTRYPDMYSALLGETAGEIPVGIETDGNSDEPFFPFACNATYKEVWTSPAARFLAAL